MENQTNFSNISAFLGTTYLVAKKTKGLITTTLWGMLINISLSAILIPLIGLNGAGVSGAIGFLVVSVIRFNQTRKFVDFTINLKLLGMLLLGYMLVSTATYMSQPIIAGFIVCIMIIIYLYTIYKLLKK